MCQQGKLQGPQHWARTAAAAVAEPRTLSTHPKRYTGVLQSRHTREGSERFCNELFTRTLREEVTGVRVS
jgi:hypothetical protein